MKYELVQTLRLVIYSLQPTSAQKLLYEVFSEKINARILGPLLHCGVCGGTSYATAVQYNGQVYL